MNNYSAKLLKQKKNLKKIDINAMTQELLHDTKIITLYKAFIAASDTSDLDNAVKLN